MKKIILFSLVAALAGVSVSCKKYLDDAKTNPNEPLKVGPKSLLASVEMATFSNFTGNNARRSSIFVQQIAGTGFQLLDTQNYLVLESDVTNDWITIYQGAIINAQIIIDNYGSESPHYAGIAKILKAMNLGLAADMWGDVPAKNAVKGTNDLQPAYDTQDAVYTYVQTLLSEGIADMKKPASANKYQPLSDYVFGGDASHWIQTAYVLKARYANRLNKRASGSSATEAIGYLTLAYNEGLASNDDDANAVFGDLGNESNQWANFNSNRAEYMKMGAFFIDTMNKSKDPRLPYFADVVPGTTVYVGGENSGSADASTSSDIGPYCDEPNAPLPLVSFVEAKFIEAECQLRLGNASGAASAHNQAVKASILAVTNSSNSTYETAHASETAGSITLAKIMIEKYKALFTQIEVWTDWRRTGLPNLSPNPDASINGIPRRLPTSQDERNNNPNAIVVSNLLSKVWFDQ